MTVDISPNSTVASRPATARIGCAGWSITGACAPEFPGTGSHLERYARVLSMAEINSSFYRPHQPQTYARWADSVTGPFRFSVKLPRSITHARRLVDIAGELGPFREQVSALGDRLGCVLVQLPPSLHCDAITADAFFSLLRRSFACTLACEARHPSWFDAPATALLTQHAITRVIADPAVGQPGPHVPTTAAIYLRLHGSPRRYYSAYADDYLLQISRDIGTHVTAGREVWCVFDNTAAGAALPNALLVQRSLVQT